MIIMQYLVVFQPSHRQMSSIESLYLPNFIQKDKVMNIEYTLAFRNLENPLFKLRTIPAKET